MKKHKVVSKVFVEFVFAMFLASFVIFLTVFSDDEHPSHVGGAKLTFADAIVVAERQTNGRAFDADMTRTGSDVYFVVETTGPLGRRTVSIDSVTGQVVDVRR